MALLKLIALLLSALLMTHAAHGAGLPARLQTSTANDAEEIMRRGGCMLCHRWTRPWIGPPFAEIAQQYRSAGPQSRQVLMARLRSGAVGNHSPIPMGSCDVTRINDAELRLVVEHILEQGSRPEMHAR